jgi:hypothetical protein
VWSVTEPSLVAPGSYNTFSATIHTGLDVEEGCYSTDFSTVMLTKEDLKVLQIPCSQEDTNAASGTYLVPAGL